MKQFVKSFLLFMMMLSLYPLSAIASSQKDDVQAAYRDWCTAIGKAKGDGKVMAAFYASDATLLPTLSAKKITTSADLIDYFNHLTSKPNIRCTTKSIHTKIHHEVATNTGFYDFSFTEKNGKTKVLPARYTFIYKNMDGKWMIIDHHSSAMP